MLPCSAGWARVARLLAALPGVLPQGALLAGSWVGPVLLAVPVLPRLARRRRSCRGFPLLLPGHKPRCLPLRTPVWDCRGLG